MLRGKPVIISHDSGQGPRVLDASELGARQAPGVGQGPRALGASELGARQAPGVGQGPRALGASELGARQAPGVGQGPRALGASELGARQAPGVGQGPRVLGASELGARQARGIGQGSRVLDASPEAAGLVVGMPLQEALSRCKDAVLIKGDEPYYGRVFDGIIDGLLQRSPLVERSDLGCAYVGVHGLEGIYADEANMMTALLKAAPQRFDARIGLAARKYPAYVAAVTGGEGRVTKVPEDAASFLEGVTVDLLPMSWKNRVLLHSFGLHTMGQVAALSISSFQAQFGNEGKVAWSLANGIDHSSLVPLNPDEKMVSEMVSFPSPATVLPTILPALEMLLSRAFVHPSIKGRCIRAASLEGRILHKPPWTKHYAFKNPMNNKEKTFNVLKDCLEATQLPGPLEDLKLTLSGIAGESGIQASLLSDVRKREQLQDMMKQLEVRLRERPPIYKAMELEPWSRIPERRQALVEFDP